jgi:hypothetical protein
MFVVVVPGNLQVFGLTKCSWRSAAGHYLSDCSSSAQAFCRFHLWILLHTGQRRLRETVILSSLMDSVVSPVGTALLNVGQRIIILGIARISLMKKENSN